MKIRFDYWILDRDDHLWGTNPELDLGPLHICLWCLYRSRRGSIAAVERIRRRSPYLAPHWSYGLLGVNYTRYFFLLERMGRLVAFHLFFFRFGFNLPTNKP